MADTGYNWSATSEHDAMGAVTDNSSDETPELDLDGKAACEIGLTLAGGAGTVDGVLTIGVLGTVDDTNWALVADCWSFTIAPIVNTTIHKQFSIDPAFYSKVKIYVGNESGITVTVTVDVKTATIPAAS